MTFPYQGKKFTQEQIEFVVAVFITSFVDYVTCIVPARWFSNDPKQDEEDDEAWRRERMHIPRKEVVPLIQSALEQLGWNLSIFYAQLQDDCLGTMDSLTIQNLGTQLEEWAYKRLDGKIGIHRNPTDPNIGTDDLPNEEQLARDWVNAMFYPERTAPGDIRDTTDQW